MGFSLELKPGSGIGSQDTDTGGDEDSNNRNFKTGYQILIISLFDECSGVIIPGRFEEPDRGNGKGILRLFDGCHKHPENRKQEKDQNNCQKNMAYASLNFCLGFIFHGCEPHPTQIEFWKS